MQADTTKKKKDIEKKANELEKKSRRKKIGETSALVHKHHSAGMAMTFLQVAIVLASVSSLLRKKFLWFGSMGIAAVGLIYLFPLLFK